MVSNIVFNYIMNIKYFNISDYNLSKMNVRQLDGKNLRDKEFDNIMRLSHDMSEESGNVDKYSENETKMKIEQYLHTSSLPGYL